ncbi:MAG: hypothetical protein ACREX9_13750 [Gammaproteobacteria bacterium]
MSSLKPIKHFNGNQETIHERETDTPKPDTRGSSQDDFELLVEFSEHLETKLPGSGPLLGRAFIWTGAGRLAGEHDPSIAGAVLKDVLQDVENGWLNPVPPKEESPTLQ